MKGRNKEEKAFVFPTSQASSSKVPKLSYRHRGQEKSPSFNTDKQQNLDISINV